MPRGTPAGGSGSAELQLLCERCWVTLEGWTTTNCPNCNSPRPNHGWATLPYTFRNRYLFVRPIGRGGMGAIFLAYDEQQEQATKVPLAVKVVPRASSDETIQQLKELFEREASAAAMLAQAPHFVRVLGHDVGVDPAYLVMEHVEWPTLRAAIRQASQQSGAPRGLSPVVVARIGIAILRGVSVMHYHRIVHRDLKPSNIFFNKNELEDYDIKILDFGVWTREAQADGPAHSVIGLGHRLDQVAVGTYSYMSPEQMAGRPVDSRSDLHSLGSVLWELATGDVPYRMNHGLKGKAAADRFERLKAPPPRPLHMPEGFYEIIARALRFEPADRWESAEEMKLALKVWAAEESLRSRNVYVDYAGRIESLDAQIEQTKSSFSPARDLLHQIEQLSGLVYLLKSQTEDATQEALSRAVDDMEHRVGGLAHELDDFARGIQNSALGLVGDRTDDLRPLERGPAAPDPADGRVYEAAFTAPSRVRFLMVTAVVAVSVAIAALGFAIFKKVDAPTRSAPGQEPALVELKVNETTAAPEDDVRARSLRLGHGGGPIVTAFSPDGRIISAGPDGRILAWRPGLTGAERVLGLHGAAVTGLDAHPSGDLIASLGADGSVRVWEVQAGREVFALGERSRATALRFSPDGRALAVGNRRGETRLYKVDTGDELELLSSDRRRRRKVRAIAFSAQGGTLAVATGARVVTFDATSGRTIAKVVPRSSGEINDVVLDPEGRWLATAHETGALWLWDATTGRPIDPLVKSGPELSALTVSKDGLWIATGGPSAEGHVFAVASRQPVSRLGRNVSKLRFGPTGKMLAATGRGRAIELYDARTGKRRSLLEAGPARLNAAAYASTGRHFATAGDDHVARLFDGASGKLLHALSGHRGSVTAVAFDEGGDRIVTGAHDGTARVWSVEGQLLARLESDGQAGVSAVAVLGSSRLVAGDERGAFYSWDLATGRRLSKRGAHKAAVSAITPSHDHALIATGGLDRRVYLWDRESGRRVRRLNVGGEVYSIAWAPDDRTLAIGSSEAVHVFRTDSGQPSRVHRSPSRVLALAFSPDGQRIVAGGSDRTARIFEANGPKLLSTLVSDGLDITAVAFGPNGRHLLTAGVEGTTRVWDLEEGTWRASAAVGNGWATLAWDGSTDCESDGCALLSPPD